MHQWRQQELEIKYNGLLTASDQDSTLCLTPADEDMDLYLSNEVKFYAAAMIQLRKVWSCPYFDSTDILGFCRIWFIQFIFLNIPFKPGFNKKPILQFFSHSIDSKPHIIVKTKWVCPDCPEKSGFQLSGFCKLGEFLPLPRFIITLGLSKKRCLSPGAPQRPPTPHSGAIDVLSVFLSLGTSFYAVTHIAMIVEIIFTV